jgi:nucleotide-binding universal stress UspA family protein
MFTNQPIIVPWDFSELSHQALLKAIELAESPAQIQVIHVTPFPSAAEPSLAWGLYSEDDLRKELSKSFRQKIPEHQYPGLTFTAKFGDPGSEIAQHAKETKAGLVVISSHGRTGIPRLLLGSVAERVVRLSPCPVLVLRREEEEEEEEE